MGIEFLLKAEPNVSGKPRIKEHYRMVSGTQRIDSNGTAVPSFNFEGHVDEDIIKQNPKEYEIFKKYVEENAEELYKTAANMKGEPLVVFPLLVKPVEPEPVKVSKKKGE